LKALLCLPLGVLHLFENRYKYGTNPWDLIVMILSVVAIIPILGWLAAATALFTDTIISLSLGSSCVMDFTRVSTGDKISVLLEPRSIVVLKDDARYQWMHIIAARKGDLFQGEPITRERRVSLTFRKVIIQPHYFQESI
jgi:hypothetical protein